MKVITLLLGASMLILFNTTLISQRNHYVVEDEFRYSKALVFFIENITMDDDESSENRRFGRYVKLKCYLENNDTIKDSLLLRFEFMLRPEEYTILDEFYYKTDSSVVKLTAMKIENLYGTQTISNKTTGSSLENVSVTTPSSTETVMNSKGESSTVTIPSTTQSVIVSVPTTHTTIETSPFRQVSIYFKLNSEDIKRILNTRDLKFRIYTNRGGSTMDLSSYEVNKLVKFIEKFRG